MSPFPTATQEKIGGRSGQVGPALPYPPVELLRGLGREVVVDWQLVPSDMEGKA
jgi:hypothetical protein